MNVMATIYKRNLLLLRFIGAEVHRGRGTKGQRDKVVVIFLCASMPLPLCAYLSSNENLKPKKDLPFSDLKVNSNLCYTEFTTAQPYAVNCLTLCHYLCH